VFGERTVLDAYDIGGDPVGCIAAPGEPAVQDDVVPVGDDLFENGGSFVELLS